MIDVREAVASSLGSLRQPRAALVPLHARDHLRRGRRDRDALDRRGRRGAGARDHRRDGRCATSWCRTSASTARTSCRRSAGSRRACRARRAGDPRRRARRRARGREDRGRGRGRCCRATGRAKPRVLGVSSDYPSSCRLALAEGRFFDREDEGPSRAGGGDRRRTCGGTCSGSSAALGKPLKVNDQWLTVIGVLAPAAAPSARCRA